MRDHDSHIELSETVGDQGQDGEGPTHDRPPEHAPDAPKEPPTFWGGLGTVLDPRESKVNWLLLAFPLSILSWQLRWGDSANFITAFISIIPMAALMGDSTEEIALRSSEALGGLLNCTFGNAVELIICIVALKGGYFEVVGASLIGSVLSNLLLVTGMAFLCGGITAGRLGGEQYFSRLNANTSSSLMTLALVGFIIPNAFMMSSENGAVTNDLLKLSRIASLILIGVYVLSLIFSLKTHAELLKREQEANLKKRDEHRKWLAEEARDNSENKTGGEESDGDDDDEEEEPKMTLFAAILLLAVLTVLVSLESELLVDAIDHVVVQWGLTEKFIGLILIPIVGNAAEHATAVTMAIRDKMDLSISVCVGSSNQIALFVAPFMVILAWCMNLPFSLNFEVFETAMVFCGVLVFNSIISSGRSNWLQGSHLIATYLLVAVAVFYHS